MPLIETKYDWNENFVLILRLFAGIVWLITVIRRLGPNYGNFEERITSMSMGVNLIPDQLMQFSVENWVIIYLLVILLEIISSLSLLTGTLARFGALLATINGFGIGMAGLGLGIIDLLIPWSIAFVTLFLLLFTHPGQYYGIDKYLVEKNLPRVLEILI